MRDLSRQNTLGPRSTALPRKPQLNIPFINETLEEIERYGLGHCNMNRWSIGDFHAHRPACGTAGCLSGWGLAVKHGKFDMNKYQGRPEKDGAALFGFPFNDEEDCEPFFVTYWPARHVQLRGGHGDVGVHTRTTSWAEGSNVTEESEQFAMITLLRDIRDGVVIFDEDGHLVDLQAS